MSSSSAAWRPAALVQSAGAAAAICAPSCAAEAGGIARFASALTTAVPTSAAVGCVDSALTSASTAPASTAPSLSLLSTSASAWEHRFPIAPAALVQSAGRHAAEEELIDYTILALDALADGGPVAVRDAGARGVVEGAIKRFATNEDIMDQSRSLMQKIGLGSAMDANKGGPVAGPGEFRL